jgi:hypothetical protein
MLPKNSAWATHGEHYFLSTARAPLMIALSIACAGAPFERGADRSDFANFDSAALRGQSGDKVTLRARTPSGEQYIDGSDILVAAGRIPNTTGIGLKETGVELEGRGYIRVNGRLETSAPDVWAVGECAGSPQFTRTYPKTTFESFVTTWREEIVAPAIG